jgi:hypothetical protein
MVADTERTRDEEPRTKVFISYSRRDIAFADQLDAVLSRRLHFRKTMGFATLNPSYELSPQMKFRR